LTTRPSFVRCPPSETLSFKRTPHRPVSAVPGVPSAPVTDELQGGVMVAVPEISGRAAPVGRVFDVIGRVAG